MIQPHNEVYGDVYAWLVVTTVASYPGTRTANFFPESLGTRLVATTVAS